LRDQKAILIKRDVGQDANAIDNIASLATISLKLNDSDSALNYVKEALTWIENNGVDGIEYPFRVYLSCINTLLSNNQVKRANDILRTAYNLLTDQSHRISDIDLRNDFLNKVPIHQEIISRGSTA
jgi:hypothetical protein